MMKRVVPQYEIGYNKTILLLAGGSSMKQQKIKVLYSFLIFMIVFSFLIQPLPEMIFGFKQIILESDILISDYFEIGGFGASILNASLLSLGSVILIRKSKAKMNGYLIATVMLMGGFGLFGKNIINVVPIILGSYLYARYSKEDYSEVVHIGLLATSFSPVVTELMFVVNMNPVLRIIVASLIGISVGCIIVPVSRHLFNTHKGYNLYNVGFSIGLLSTLYVSVMKSYGFVSYQRLILSTGNNKILAFCLILLFGLTFLYGAYLTKFKFKDLFLLFKETGYKDNDFVVKYGVGTSLMNMAINGILALFYVVVIAKGELNGPSIGGILTVYGFGGLGKHWRNITPIFLGVYLGSLTKYWNAAETSSLFAALFGTALAPVAGKFGFIAGVVISLINSSVVLNSGFLHGGMNLYNTGFSVGLVAAVVIPILEMVKKQKEIRKTKFVNNK